MGFIICTSKAAAAGTQYVRVECQCHIATGNMTIHKENNLSQWFPMGSATCPLEAGLNAAPQKSMPRDLGAFGRISAPSHRGPAQGLGGNADVCKVGMSLGNL